MMLQLKMLKYSRLPSSIQESSLKRGKRNTREKRGHPSEIEKAFAGQSQLLSSELAH